MSASKRKGTHAETAVVRWLNALGWVGAERRALRGASDAGDCTGIPGVCLEVKACKRLELAQWIDELAKAKTNAGADVAAILVKRRGKASPDDWYAVMPGAQLAQLLDEAGYR